MANRTAVTMSVADGACQIMIWYNDANLRIGNVEWTLAAGYAGRVIIKDSGVVIYDQVYGSGSGAESIPGNYRMVEAVDPDLGPYFDFPPEISVDFKIRTI